MYSTDFQSWESRPKDIQSLVAQGKIPVVHDMEEREKKGDIDEETEMNARPYLMGQVAAAIKDIQPAKQIIDEMMAEAIKQIQRSNGLIHDGARL